MAYFNNIKSFEDLKEQFKALARANHPDCGGDAEIMKAINAEYDTLFPIWKHRYNATAEKPTDETAESTRYHFYTQNGWAGKNYHPFQSTKEIAAIIRAYVKEIYPTYRFSVRFESASMCSEIHTRITEAPEHPYKQYEELTQEERWDVWRKATYNRWVEDFGCLDDEHNALLKKAYDEHDFLKCFTEKVKAVIDDVEAQVNSYRYDDSDGMIDYFDTNFYYFGCKLSDKFKIVPRTPRVKNQKKEAATKKTPETSQELPENAEAEEYDIQKTQHTKTGETIWVVKILRKLSRDEYLKAAEKMNSLGGYYSKFVHGFVF